jgi:hypothetical protein
MEASGSFLKFWGLFTLLWNVEDPVLFSPSISIDPINPPPTIVPFSAAFAITNSSHFQSRMSTLSCYLLHVQSLRVHFGANLVFTSGYMRPIPDLPSNGKTA